MLGFFSSLPLLAPSCSPLFFFCFWDLPLEVSKLHTLVGSPQIWVVPAMSTLASNVMQEEWLSALKELILRPLHLSDM